MTEPLDIPEDAPEDMVAEAQAVQESFEEWKELEEEVSKAWIPYEGPHGGEGWQNVETGEVRYVDEPPGPTEDGPVNESPQRWGDWDRHGDDEDPEDEEDGPDDGRGQITWENVEVGDEIAYYDMDGEIAEGEVTADERGPFGVLWAEHPDGGKEPVEQDDLIGGAEEVSFSAVEAPDTVTNEWMDENIFYGQTVKLRNKDTGELIYTEVEEVFTAGGDIHGFQTTFEEHGFTTSASITSDEIDWGHQDDNDEYEIVSTEEWSELSEEEQQNALQQAYRDTRFSQISYQTRETVNEQFKDEVIPSFKDNNVARETMKSLFKIEDRVSRASCRGTNSVQIKLSENAPLTTTQHEMGHAVVGSFGYNYQHGYDESEYSDEKYRRRPTNLSHDYTDFEKGLVGGIPFDFSEDSNFFDPEDYMLRDVHGSIHPSQLEIGETYGEEDWNLITPTSIEQRDDGVWEVEVEEYGPPIFFDEDGEMLDTEESVSPDTNFDPMPTGYAEWKDEVEAEVWDIEHSDLDERDYKEPGDKSAAEVFLSLDEGDAVRLDVPTRDPEINHLVFRGAKPGSDTEFVFERPDGSTWHWAVNPMTGELVSMHDSEVTGYDDTRSDEGHDSGAESEAVEDPLENWEGFKPNPETTEERVRNLVSAVNRSWYAQARMFEQDIGFESAQYTIGSGYSATNAHETMAKVHEVMQSKGNKADMFSLMSNHPWLVAAYTDVFEIPQHTRARAKVHDNYDKYGFDL